MARGHEIHQQRVHAMALLGRPLCRRASSRCELCGGNGVSLFCYEVHPLQDEPEVDRALLLCASCRDGAMGGRLDPLAWRFLETAAWSELPPLQVTAVRLLRRLATERVDWAEAALDILYLPPEVEEWLG